MSKEKKLRLTDIISVILLSFLTVITIVGVALFIKFKNETIEMPETEAPKAPISVSVSEDPVVTPEIIYTNEAATYQAPHKDVATMLCYNADGSLRNEYRYDEFGRLLYFYSHSSTSETKLTLTDDGEILSTYTNSKHFGDEYYNLNHDLIYFKNIKNGYSYTYEYDSFGNLLTESYLTTAGAERFTVYTYNSDNLPSTVQCTLNGVLNSTCSFSYENGLLVHEISSALIVDSEYVYYETFYTYDSEGRLLTMKKYRSDESKLSEEPVQWEETCYDQFGRVTYTAKTCDSSERVYKEEYTFSENGLEARCDYAYIIAATGKTDPLFDSGYILYEWDKAGNVTKKATYSSKSEPVTEHFEYEYDSDHCIIKQINYFNDAVSSSYEYTYFE